MTGSKLEAVFREIPRSSLEADPAVCFILDEKLRLIHCNQAWNRFALDNGAPALRAERVLGSSVLDSTPDAVHAYYQAFYNAALQKRVQVTHDFHCSSAERERLMTMQVYPLRSTPALLVACSIRVERPHSEPSFEPIQDIYRNEHGFISMCSNCRRTRRGPTGGDTWDWVSDFVRDMPPRVSHSVCGLCLEYYYPMAV